MNGDAISATAEVFGLAAVVISLLYVGLQIRQQTREFRLAAIHEATSALSRFFTLRVYRHAGGWVKNVKNPDTFQPISGPKHRGFRVIQDGTLITTKA